MKSKLGAVASVYLILCLAAGLLCVGLIASDGAIRASSGEFRLLPELNLLAYSRRPGPAAEEDLAYLRQVNEYADSLRDAGPGLPARLISVWAWMALVNIFAVWLLRLFDMPLSKAAKSEVALEEFYPAAFVPLSALSIPALALGVLTFIARLTRGEDDPEGPSVESEDS